MQRRASCLAFVFVIVTNSLETLKTYTQTHTEGVVCARVLRISSARAPHALRIFIDFGERTNERRTVELSAACTAPFSEYTSQQQP